MEKTGQKSGVGLRFKLFRTAKGLSQEALGKILGYSGSHVSTLENGKAYIKVVDIEKLSNLYGLSLEYILEGTGPMIVKKTAIADLEELDNEENVDQEIAKEVQKNRETLELFSKELIEDKPAEEEKPLPFPMPEERKPRMLEKSKFKLASKLLLAAMPNFVKQKPNEDDFTHLTENIFLAVDSVFEYSEVKHEVD